MTGPEYFSLEASGRPMLVIGRSYFYPRGLPLSIMSVRLEGGGPYPSPSLAIVLALILAILTSCLPF